MGVVTFVKTSLSNDKDVRCESCGEVIAKLENDEMIPSAEECHKKGNVPVPNLGCFCSQECANKFEKNNNVKFERTEDGLIDYYSNK